MPDNHISVACKCGSTYSLILRIHQEVPATVMLQWTCGACMEATMLSLEPEKGCSPREMLGGAVLDALDDMSPEEIHAAVDEWVVRKVMEA